MNVSDARERVLAAHKLLAEETTTREKVESVKALIKGLNPRIDTALATCSQMLSDLEKLKQGDVIELTVSHLSEETQEDKKRKRALLLFIRSWKELQSEVERIQQELPGDFQDKSRLEQTSNFARIAAGAKGPFGIVTIIAVIVVVGIGIVARSNQGEKMQSSVKGEQIEAVTSEKTKTQVIEFAGQKIPLSQLEARSGPDCDSQHYHAKNNISVVSLEGKTILDPGGCAFGKVKEVEVLEVLP